MSSRLEAVGITKEFPGVKALDGVNFSLRPGEIHALCGENGAGKSTLMKIMAGVYPSGSFGGKLILEGQELHLHNISQSRESGISVVFQELSLIPEMTVAENIFLGREPNRLGRVERAKLFADTTAVLKRVGLSIAADAPVKLLGIGEKQMIEIAKALAQNPKILILDEPTSALAEREVDRFLDVVKTLRGEGVSVILVTHKLKEVFKVSDRITILRDGKFIRTLDAKECTEDQLISLMVGRQIENLYPHSERQLGDEVFKVKDLSVAHPRFAHRKLLDSISWSIRQGEILGLAGLMGSGRTEMLMAIFGALHLPSTGKIEVRGREVKIGSPRQAHAAGLALASEDRKRFGLILDDPIFKNITLPSLKKFSKFGIVNRALEFLKSSEQAARFRVKAPSVVTIAKTLSGGNQQKVVLGKCVLQGPSVLFLDEPTRGIDVGARREIYEWIHKLASEGMAVVVVSSEMQEVIGLSDRILVLCEGRITAEFPKNQASEEKILAAATRFAKTGAD